MKLTIRVSNEAFKWPKELRGKQFSVTVASIYTPQGTIRSDLEGVWAVPVGLDSNLNEWRPGRTLKERKVDDILAALAYFNGSRTKAAISLGMSVRQMYCSIDTLKEKGYTIPPPPVSSIKKKPFGFNLKK